MLGVSFCAVQKGAETKLGDFVQSCVNVDWVVVSFFFDFHPYLGKIPFLTNIFQRG